MRKQILNYVIVSLCFYSINLFGTAINLNGNRCNYEIETLEVNGFSLWDSVKKKGHFKLQIY